MKGILTLASALVLVSASALAEGTSSNTSNNTSDAGSLSGGNSSVMTRDDANMGTTTDEQAGTAAESDTTTSQPGTMGSDTTTSGTTSDASSTYSPTNFRRDVGFNKVHHLHLSEIEMAKLAADRASSPEVKNYAARIQSDHETADKKLQEVAKSQNIQLQSFQPSTSEVAMMDRLKALSGTQFDRAFMDSAKWTHAWASDMLSQLNKDVKDPQLKAQISSFRPKIEQHGKMARQAKVPMASAETSS